MTGHMVRQIDGDRWAMPFLVSYGHDVRRAGANAPGEAAGETRETA